MTRIVPTHKFKRKRDRWFSYVKPQVRQKVGQGDILETNWFIKALILAFIMEVCFLFFPIIFCNTCKCAAVKTLCWDIASIFLELPFSPKNILQLFWVDCNRKDLGLKFSLNFYSPHILLHFWMRLHFLSFCLSVVIISSLYMDFCLDGSPSTL